MEGSSASHASQSGNRIPFGMNSFGEDERREFGERMRLAMACIDGSKQPDRGKAMPSEATAISQRLTTLSQDIASHHADLLELLVRFDDLEGWKSAGAKHCVAWMNLELGIHMKLGWEYLRVGRELRSLPTTTALFRAGKLSWSKVRHISRVADKDSEKLLCHAALDASASDVEHLCLMYRWRDDEEDGDGGENGRSLLQWEKRSLSHSTIGNGSTLIRLSLPPELAQAFLNSVEYSLTQLEDSDCTISQRRADAALLMAEASLLKLYVSYCRQGFAFVWLTMRGATF